MEDLLNNLKAHAKNVALTAGEKSAGREALRSFMALTPNRLSQAKASKPKRFAFLRLSHAGRAAGVFAASFALLLSAGGISYAAEGAVPGDTLYPVKVSFSEPIRAAVAVSEKDRAEWSAERASRRLAEAEVLAQRGKLEAEMRASLDADFQRFSEGAELHLAKVREEDDADAADVSAHIEGTLRAHSQIMAALAENRRERRKAAKLDDRAEGGDAGDNGDDEEHQVAVLAASVDQQVSVTIKENDSTETRASSGGSVKAAGFARGRHDAAVRKIAEVRSWLAAKSGSFTADSRTQADARLTAADSSVAAGDAALAAGKNREAFAAYAKAQRLAQEAKLIVRASNDLGVQVRFKDSSEDDTDREGDADKRNGDGNDRGGLDLNADAGVHLDGLLGGHDRGSSDENRRRHGSRDGSDN